MKVLFIPAPTYHSLENELGGINMRIKHHHPEYPDKLQRDEALNGLLHSCVRQLRRRADQSPYRVPSAVCR